MKPTKKQIKIVIIGASGFGREVLWTLRDCNKKSKKYDILGFVDDNKSLWGTIIDEIPVLGGLGWLSTKIAKKTQCIVAIGETRMRKDVVKKLEKKNAIFATIIHPSVIHSRFVHIGKGTIIQAGSILTIDIRIGDHVHINIDSTVGHNSVIADFVTINPGVHVNGNTMIEEGVYVGTGATLKQKIRIGRWSVIGAGTVLLDDVPKSSLYVGVPGKLKRTLTTT